MMSLHPSHGDIHPLLLCYSPLSVCRSSYSKLDSNVGTSAIPETFGVFEQGRKHYGQNDFYIIADQVAEVLIVPEVKRALGDLV